MDLVSLFAGSFLSVFLLTLTGYSIYLGFGPGSEDLRDPFEEHED